MLTKTQDLAKKIRLHALRMVTDAKASHIGSALSIADIVAVLYGEILKFDCNQPKLFERDRFILSKGHACTVVYAALAEVGFFPVSKLKDYGKNYSNFMAHISHKVPGVEFSTGSLGHGLPFAVGKALAAKKNNLDWGVFTLLSDGELDEGSNWEAIMFAAHHQLDNLTIIIDYNNLQSLDTVRNTLGLEPLLDKFISFGADVSEINGHMHDQLIAALAKPAIDKPKVVIARTTKGKGVSFMENQVAWHYKNPTEEQLSLALREVEVGHA